MGAVKLAGAALLGAAAAYLLMKRAPAAVQRLGLRVPARGQLCHGFGGFAGPFASPGLED